MEYRRGRSLMERWTAVLSPNSLGLERVKRARQAERTISSKANNTSCKSSFLERCAHAATPFLSSSLEDDFSVSSSLGLIARAHTHTRVRLLSFLSYSLFSPFPFSISSIVHLSPPSPFRLWRKTNLSITFFDRFRGKLEGKRKKKKIWRFRLIRDCRKRIVVVVVVVRESCSNRSYQSRRGEEKISLRERRQGYQLFAWTGG